MVGATSINESRRQFINENWLSLAAGTFEGFQRAGRGAMHIFLDSEVIVKGKTGLMALYLPGRRLESMPGWPGVGATEAIASYDPRREVLVWFKWDGGQEFLRIPSGAVTPEEAARIRENNERITSDDTNSVVIRERWPEIATIAWSGFNVSGRGVVVIDVDNTDLSQPSRFFSAYYLPGGDNAQSTARRHFIRGNFASKGDPFLAAFEESIARYKPEAEANIIFCGQVVPLELYTMGTQPCPPEAYALQQRVGAQKPPTT